MTKVIQTVQIRIEAPIPSQVECLPDTDLTKDVPSSHAAGT